METESLDDQEVSSLANNMSNMSTSLQNGNGKGRKHSFFQVGFWHFLYSQITK